MFRLTMKEIAAKKLRLVATAMAVVLGVAFLSGTLVLTDTVTNQPVHASANVELTCGTGASGGPCDLALAAHDFLQYASNPAASAPLASGGIVIDGCGRYRFSDLTAPASGAVAIVVDDASDTDLHMPTATLHTLGANDQVIDVVTARPSVEDELLAEHRLYGSVPAGHRFSTGQWLTAVAVLETHAEMKAEASIMPKTIWLGFVPIALMVRSAMRRCNWRWRRSPSCPSAS